MLDDLGCVLLPLPRLETAEAPLTAAAVRSLSARRGVDAVAQKCYSLFRVRFSSL